jgi:hypothetical protein
VGALLLALALAASGCNATCVRDSDCMGASMCSENRCILIVAPDAGRSSSSTPDEPDAATSSPDAGD